MRPNAVISKTRLWVRNRINASDDALAQAGSIRMTLRARGVLLDANALPLRPVDGAKVYLTTAGIRSEGNSQPRPSSPADGFSGSVSIISYPEQAFPYRAGREADMNFRPGPRGQEISRGASTAACDIPAFGTARVLRVCHKPTASGLARGASMDLCRYGAL